jgi:hypothetical protein
MSTKVTRLFGEHFHLYTDYAIDLGHTLILEVDGKVVPLPKDFLEALRKLLLLQECSKIIIETVGELDKIDGGLFAIKLKKKK